MPIFMIGTRRSGSNLLRLMINQLPEIVGPHPPHFIERLVPLLPAYGDLSVDENFATLVDDACRLVELNPVPWDGVKLDRDDVAGRSRARSVAAVHGALYDLVTEASGAKDWCCKSVANVRYLSEITPYFPDGKFVYLYRDGRDAAVSFRKAMVGEKHFYSIGCSWNEDQQLALGLGEKLGSDQFFPVSYEELTRDTEKVMRALAEFLGATYTDEVLQFNRSQEATRTAAECNSLWGNVTRPVMGNNSRKFLKQASEEDVRIFESVAGESLDALGYERAFVKPGEELKFTREQIAAFEAENERQKAKVLGNLSPEEDARHEPQRRLIQEIRARISTPQKLAV